MLEKLDKIPKSAWTFLYVISLTFVLPVGIGLAGLLLNSGSLKYENGETVVSIGEEKKRELINEKEFSNKQLHNKIEKLERIIEEQNIEKIAPDVAEAFEDLQPTAEYVIKTSEKLTNVIE